MTVELKPGIFQFPAKKPASHVYLVKGTTKNVLIDTGTAADFPKLEVSLAELDIKPSDIHFIILTHAHFDHIGATSFFFETAIVAAHRLAANKIELQDEFVTMMKVEDSPAIPFHANVWLEDGTIIDLGNYQLRTVHTPGHTSGCICLYEPREKLLFSGDTVFAGGTLSGIFGSGSISDYMNSLSRLTALKINELYPGHGWLSNNAEEDMLRGLEYARSLFEDTKLLFESLLKRDG